MQTFSYCFSPLETLNLPSILSHVFWLRGRIISTLIMNIGLHPTALIPILKQFFMNNSLFLSMYFDFFFISVVPSPLLTICSDHLYFKIFPSIGLTHQAITIASSFCHFKNSWKLVCIYGLWGFGFHSLTLYHLVSAPHRYLLLWSNLAILSKPSNLLICLQNLRLFSYWPARLIISGCVYEWVSGWV